MHNQQVPFDVPRAYSETFLKHYDLITRGKENIFFAVFDHGIEHLDSTNPESIFTIAAHGVGALVAPLGLIAKYAHKCQSVPYIVKITGKTNLIPNTEKDPYSVQLHSVADVVRFKEESELFVCGVAVTVYPGSMFEHLMLQQAARTIFEAHQHGLLAGIWMYPRGHVIKQETNPDILAGAVALANSLGADFVKIKLPTQDKHDSFFEECKHIIAAAGKTKVVFSGGEMMLQTHFLDQVECALSAGFSGIAVGRNLFSRPICEAEEIRMALTKMIYKTESIE